MDDPCQFSRLPPSSIDAEKCLIASMMLDKAIIPQVVAMVDAGSFVQADHAILFDVLLALANDGRSIDAIIVADELTRRHKLDAIGGMAYIGTVLGAVPSSQHAMQYAAAVREKAMLRGIQAESYEALRQVELASDKDRASDIIQAMMTRLAALNASVASTQCVSLGDAVAKAFYDLENGGTSLVKTGVEAIDADMGGVGIGEMLIIGARPSMGKSTLMRQIAAAAAGQGTPVGIISLEESAPKIARNLLSAYSPIENNRLRRGKLEAADWAIVANGVAALSGLPVYIADRAFRMNAIRAVASMMVSKHGVKLFILDYLQKVQANGKDRYEKVTNASSELSLLWKELNAAGIVLAQLSRGVAGRDNKRPGMTDLRESGQIEQDADQILLLHREDYYRATGESKEGAIMDGVAELIKAKYRDGNRSGTIYLKSNLKYQRFETAEQKIQTPFDQPRRAPRVSVQRDAFSETEVA